MIYPLAGLVLGSPFLLDTIAWNNQQPGDFSVVNYNIKGFHHFQDNSKEQAQLITNWILSEPADVICLQEFYTRNREEYRFWEQNMKKRGYSTTYSVPADKRPYKVYGLIIFSKFPVINTGRIDLSPDIEQYSQAIYADLLIEKDTIRIYNTHLHSMGIKERNLLSREDTKAKYRDIFDRLKTGFIQRAKQVRILSDELAEVDAKLILCGDVNDIPYTYTYQHLSDILDNSFEDAGRGFGFSFNGLLFFLRIDNQFYSENLDPESCRVLREINYSDHFPLKCTYKLN